MAEFVISSAISVLEFLLYEKAFPQRGWEYQPFVVAKAAMLTGSEEHFRGLKSDLVSMLGFLRESDGSRNRQHLITQVREMANDAGVIIDMFVFSWWGELETIRLSHFLKEIKSIRRRLREVNDLRVQFPVEEAEDIRREEEEIPCEAGTDEIISEPTLKRMINCFVLSRKPGLFTSMFLGVPGSGKTTFARQLYNHPAVVTRFDFRLFKQAPRELQQPRVQFKEEEEKGLVDQQRFIEALRGKRYFIVFDDVQDVRALKLILDALPREGNSSRVLLTSRSRSITMNSCVDHHFYIDPWPFSDSWEFFLKTVFNSYYKCPRHLEKIGKKIVAKCEGLPLAIKEVGMQLKTKSQTESAWEEFLKSMDFSQTLAAMEMSYHKLSPAQKSYFLHMSFFQEGTIIRTQKSAHIWNSAGMVTRAGQTPLMEANPTNHFIELSFEMVIRAVDYKLDLHIKSFRINVFLHKICTTKAKEEIGFQILRHEELCPPACRPRHRAIHCSREKFNYLTDEDKNLISLFFHGGGSCDATPHYWKSFEQLRILDFEGFGLKSFVEILEGALSGLRYLALRDNYLQELPHTFGRLQNLEVLDIAQNFMIEVPDIIFYMHYVRHLYMSDIICRTPLKIDSLWNLQTLTYISIDNWMYESPNLENMHSLLKLGIEELDESSYVSKLFASLVKLKNLKCLILKGFRFRSMPPLDNLSAFNSLIQLKLDGRLTRLPELPPNINYLTLVNSCLEEDPMPELEKLPYLRSLKLRNAYTGQEIVFSRPDSKLGLLILEELWHLKNLKVETTFKCCLWKLRISHCPYLESIPKEMISFDEWDLQTFEMVTTRKIAKGFHQSRVASVLDWEVQPYR